MRVCVFVCVCVQPTDTCSYADTYTPTPTNPTHTHTHTHTHNFVQRDFDALKYVPELQDGVCVCVCVFVCVCVCECVSVCVCVNVDLILLSVPLGHRATSKARSAANMPSGASKARRANKVVRCCCFGFWVLLLQFCSFRH